jgi:hypothetical protein
MPVVYLVDERISNPRLVLESVPDSDLGFSITSYMSIPEIVTAVIGGLASAAPARPRSSGALGSATSAVQMISTLRIMAHGDSGQLFLGRGVDARTAVQLTPLAGLMRAGAAGHCYLLGCNVASSTHRAERFLGGAATGNRIGSPCSGWGVGEMSVRHGAGYLLLHAIARTLGVSVTAGLDTQSSALDWHFIGATMTVDPFGQIAYTGMDTPACI